MALRCSARSRALALGILIGLAAPVGADAAHGPQLTVAAGAFDPVHRNIALTVRCRGTRAECRANLTVLDLGDDPLTVSRRFGLRPGRPTRVRLRLQQGIDAAERVEPEQQVRLAFKRRGHRRIRRSFDVTSRYSCTSGATIRVTARVRVFRVARDVLFACARPHGQPFVLGRLSYEPFNEFVTFAAATGPFVAIISNAGSRCRSNYVVIIDVKTGRTTSQHPVTTSTFSDAHGCKNSGDVGSLVLADSGEAAFIETPGNDGRAVVRVIGPSEDRVLDTGPDIDVHSLVLDGDTLHWVRAGSVQSAPLR